MYVIVSRGLHLTTQLPSMSIVKVTLAALMYFGLIVPAYSLGVSAPCIPDISF